MIDVWKIYAVAVINVKDGDDGCQMCVNNTVDVRDINDVFMEYLVRISWNIYI